jgi:hypothetical protein
VGVVPQSGMTDNSGVRAYQSPGGRWSIAREPDGSAGRCDHARLGMTLDGVQRKALTS